MSEELKHVAQVVRFIENQVLPRADEHGLTEGLWLFAGQWRAVLAALKDRDVVLEEAAKVASYGRSELQPFVEGAAVAWCGQKDRETFTSDLDYFKENWWALQGMQDFVRAFAIRNLKERV